MTPFGRALVSLAKTQRRIAGEYAAELRAGRHSLATSAIRREIARLRAGVRTHLEFARREKTTP